jgi:hypothetical protein
MNTVDAQAMLTDSFPPCAFIPEQDLVMTSTTVSNLRIEGYAIVSTDGMLTNTTGVMPEALKFAADRRFFERGLDGVDILIHGRHSHEQQTPAKRRRRLILTRQIPTIAVDALDQDALLWNPAGASLASALAALGAPAQSIGVIGGTGAFELFLNSYDVFYLSRAPWVRLPGGRPVFNQVPGRTPEQVLGDHGMVPGSEQVLDPEKGVTMVNWLRSTGP